MPLDRYHPKVPLGDDYQGKHDYQGNHDVFEMPEDQKPVEHFRLPPLSRIGIVIILLGVIIALILACTAMLQQSL